MPHRIHIVGAAHSLEHLRVSVLERQVKVMAHPGVLCHHLDEFGSDMLRVSIHKAEPR